MKNFASERFKLAVMGRRLNSSIVILDK